MDYRIQALQQEEEVFCDFSLGDYSNETTSGDLVHITLVIPFFYKK
jgi:hypothetical protein